MGFSGKPSKGCLPCREKRTKCDLALPSCTQCIRKKRICTGYRNEQDLLFKNETGQVVRRAKRKPQSQAYSQYAFAVQQQSVSPQRPSRRAVLEDEAVMYFFGHYNEKFYSATNQDGLDFITPIFQSDSASGGPILDVVLACGLAALGNSKGSPEVLAAARSSQLKTLQKLNRQLQDPKTALSDSSALTCLLLSSFENIMSDTAHSLAAYQAHLRGAATIASMRGRQQFNSEIGWSIYARMRGALIASCIRAREPLPDFIIDFMEDEELGQKDFQTFFVKLLARICRLRADHKILGFVDEHMAREIIALMRDVEAWDPGERPAAEHAKHTVNADKTYHLVWQASFWVFQLSARVLITDLYIEWVSSQHTQAPNAATSRALDKANQKQLDLCEELKESTSYYLDQFAASPSGTRVVGAHSLMYPLSVLTSISTTTPATYVWIAKEGERLAEVFGIRLGKMIADMVWAGIRAAQSQTMPVRSASASSTP